MYYMYMHAHACDSSYNIGMLLMTIATTLDYCELIDTWLTWNSGVSRVYKLVGPQNGP